jgi:hypothetical protein
MNRLTPDFCASCKAIEADLLFRRDHQQLFRFWFYKRLFVLGLTVNGQAMLPSPYL